MRPRTTSITFGRTNGDEILIGLNETCAGYLTVSKTTGVYATLFEVEEEPLFASDDHGGTRGAIAAAKAWVRAKLAP